MWKALKQLFKYSSEHGTRFPAAYDVDKPGASVALLFAHLSFYLAFGAIVSLLTNDILNGTIAAMIFAALYFIFYMLRTLTKASVDFDDRSINLENETEQKDKE